MRSLLIRGGIAIAALAVLWLFAARSLSLLVDQIATARVASLAASPLAWNGAYFVIGSRILGLAAPGLAQAIDPRIDAGGRLILSTGAESIVLGSRVGPDALPATFASEPGDETSFTIERSWLSWPTPFELNVMTGRSPSWRRNRYYRLSWTKRSGARLELLWRFEQYYYAGDGWAGGDMIRPGSSGLIRATISPAARD